MDKATNNGKETEPNHYHMKISKIKQTNAQKKGKNGKRKDGRSLQPGKIEAYSREK